MTPIQQVIDAVLFRRDRIVVRLADHFDALDVDFVSARRPRVGPRGAGDDERCLLREVIRGLEQIVAHGGLRHHALNEARAVAQDQKMDLAARSAVVQPPFDGDVFTLVLADILYVDVSHRSIFSRAVFARASVSFAAPRASTSKTSGAASAAIRSTLRRTVSRVPSARSTNTFTGIRRAMNSAWSTSSASSAPTGACTLCRSSPASASHCCRSATTDGL